jgi:hypothetical protein
VPTGLFYTDMLKGEHFDVLGLAAVHAGMSLYRGPQDTRGDCARRANMRLLHLMGLREFTSLEAVSA